MKEVLDQIIAECAQRGIPVKVVPAGRNRIAYEVSGFSKSGTALVYIHKCKILCETRYQTIEEIDSFHELALIALECYLIHKERIPFEEPDAYWAEYWVEKGIMRKSIQTIYTINR